jgi:hypothetical protein
VQSARLVGAFARILGEERRLAGESIGARVASADCGLVSGQEFGIFDGTVVMDLAPASGIVAAKDARGSDGQSERCVFSLQLSSFAAHRIEDIADVMNGVIVELDADLGGVIENALIDRPDFVPAA